jgi:N-acetylglutamate synthase-like GNAT family acetyltransferase
MGDRLDCGPSSPGVHPLEWSIMFRIKKIDTQSPLYPQECDLRESVLLRPIGYDMSRFRSEYPEMEDELEHFVAVVDHPSGTRVVGCAVLRGNYPEDGSGKVMQVAVDPQRQGEGIGRHLIIAIESHGFGRLGLDRLFCHAQLSAIPFYERLGWTVDSDVFTEAGIEHRKLSIRNTAPESDGV